MIVVTSFVFGHASLSKIIKQERSSFAFNRVYLIQSNETILKQAVCVADRKPPVPGAFLVQLQPVCGSVHYSLSHSKLLRRVSEQ